MAQNDKIQLFEDKRIRTAWDEEKEEWYFSIVDVVGVLTDSVDPTAYWRKPKQRLKAEGNEIVTNCHSLKMTASDGKTQLSQTKLYCAIGQMVSGRTEKAPAEISPFYRHCHILCRRGAAGYAAYFAQALSFD